MRGRKVFESDFGLMVKDMLENEGVAVGPGVVEQLVMFCHTYITQITQSAQDIVGSSDSIAPEHVTLASELRRKNLQPLNAEELRALAQEINATRLASVADRPGLKLPVEEECLLAPNYQVCENGVAQIPRTDSALFDVSEEDVLALFEAEGLSGASHSDSDLGNGGEASDELVGVASMNEPPVDEDQKPIDGDCSAQASTTLPSNHPGVRAADAVPERQRPSATPQKPPLFGAIPSAQPDPPPAPQQTLQQGDPSVMPSKEAKPAIPLSEPQEVEKGGDALLAGASNASRQGTTDAPPVELPGVAPPAVQGASTGGDGGATAGMPKGEVGALVEEDYGDEMTEGDNAAA